MKELEARLEARVRALAGDIGARHFRRPAALRATEDYLRRELAALGAPVSELPFEVAGARFVNLEVLLPSTCESGPLPELVVGAHYDTVPSTPGADDNASAVAALLELVARLGGQRFPRAVRLVFFPNEEPPFFPGMGMGSAVYARALKRAGVAVRVMLSLEMLGYYSDEPGSQKYPPGLGFFYPDRGNFIGFVGNFASRREIALVKETFRAVSDFPVESLAAPAFTIVVGLSDQRSFWAEGYPGLMVTDTAFMRNPHYHAPTDTPDTLDYPRMARVVEGLVATVARLADA